MSVMQSEVFEALRAVMQSEVSEALRAVMQSEVFEALRAIDIPEDKAVKAATALSKRDDDVSSIKGELLVIKWMMGSVLAFQLAILVKMFLR